ncbi:MAG: hypothetical protein M1820_001110 [Bogoriella megaspora]|nr:MAG: hypothetical protein M1820_001110 [Bogoriella megaspora]
MTNRGETGWVPPHMRGASFRQENVAPTNIRAPVSQAKPQPNKYVIAKQHEVKKPEFTVSSIGSSTAGCSTARDSGDNHPGPKRDASEGHPCPFKGCGKTFPGLKELVRHKINEDDHHYCKKCDKNFVDYDAYLVHRVASPVHITCEHCGQDFGSKSGLERHLKLSHPRNQNIECKACSLKFSRASTYVHHLENGYCEKSPDSAQHLKEQRQQKHIRKQVLRNPAQFTYAMTSQQSELTPSEYDDDEEGSGGVTVIPSALDEDSEEQRNVSIKPLEPQRDLIEFSSNIDTSDVKATHHLDGRYGGMSTGILDVNSEDSTRVQSMASGSNVAGRYKDWQAALAELNREYKEENADNLMHTHNVRVYNPDSEQFDPSRFWDAQLQAYKCPYARCEMDATCTFENQEQIRQHMVTAHAVTRLRCPYCLKIFPTSAALMAHCESTSDRCKIADTRDYPQFIDELTGGFLTVKSGVDHKSKEPLYESARPPDFW